MTQQTIDHTTNSAGFSPCTPEVRIPVKTAIDNYSKPPPVPIQTRQSF